MATQTVKTGFFEDLLLYVGLISGAIFGYNNGEWIGLIVGALAFAAIGKWVGAAADWLVQLIVLIALLLINRVIRAFIWEIITSIFA